MYSSSVYVAYDTYGYKRTENIENWFLNLFGASFFPFLAGALKDLFNIVIFYYKILP
jgi:hypothetical protein